MSGVAMRSTAAQKAAEVSSSRISFIVQVRCPAPPQRRIRYCVSIVATSIAISATATITSAM